jgi:hypothetical protein
MTRRILFVVVLVSVVLAGCAGLQGTDDETGVETDQIPGVSNGILTDAESLVAANSAAIAETGGEISVVYDGPDVNSESVLTVGADGTSILSATTPDGSTQSGTLDVYTNDTATYIQMQSDGESRYRVVDQERAAFDRVNASLTVYLAAGEFSVSNSSTDPTTAVFTADNFSGLDDSGFLDDASSVSARLVVDQSGQVQNLTVTGEPRSETVTFSYELRQSAVEQTSAPEWVGEIPPAAAVQPELAIDVENDSHFHIEHTGGDAVPQNATLEVATDDASGTVTFDSALAAGESRYAYFAANNGSLILTNEQPAAGTATPLKSPASIEIRVGETTLHSGSMGWGSESASEGTTSGSSGGES